MESPTHSLVDRSLGCLPTVLDISDFSTIKHDVFPLVAAVFSKTSSLGIKIRALEAFVVLCGGSSSGVEDDHGDGLDGTQKDPSSRRNNTAVLDKFTVQEKVVPLLKAIKTKEPAVMMAALAVFRQVGRIADSDFLAIDVLPILWNFSLGPLLNVQQFKGFMDLIRMFSSKIEQEQTKKLLELSSNSANGFDASQSKDLMGTGLSQNGNLEIGQDEFERLVLGKRTGAGADLLGDSLRPQAPRSQSTRTETPVFSWSSPTNSSNPQSGILTPRQASNARTITPDQSLSGFAPLKPSSSSGLSNTMGTDRNTLTPMQPLSAAPPWAPSTLTMNNMSGGLSNMAFSQNPRPTTPYSSFSKPPPLTSSNSFHSMQPAQSNYFNGVSIAPPLTPRQGRNTQPLYGGGLGGMAGTAALSSTQTSTTNSQEKKGLDAYESLL